MSDSYETTTKEHRGHTITLEWHYDHDCEAPWEHEDGHGPVSDWTQRDKRPGERLLNSDRHSNRYYDFAEAVKIAKRDGWGLCDEAKAKLAAKLGRKPTRKEIIVQSVEQDFEYLRRWCDDNWHWCGYVMTVTDADGKEIYEDSLWGIDSDSQEEFEEEQFQHAINRINKEIDCSQDAACRDIATV